MSAAQIAAKIMAPVVQEVAEWLEGKGERRPRVLSLLPNELQSRVAQLRLESRFAAGLEKRPEPPLVAPDQVSNIRVTTGPVPEKG